MRAFKDNAPLRLSLPWAPSGNTHTLGDRVEDAGLRHLIGDFNHYDVTPDQIHFYMHPPMRKNDLKKALRHDKSWIAFARDNPGVQLAWVDELQGHEP